MCAIYINKQTKGMTAKLLELTEIYANKLIVPDHLMKYLTKNNIPIENFVCFASDGASNKMGCKNW